ncbi:MAG: protein TolQ [Chlorobium limicola]|uniref:Protein TolQ n=1 Tax=Chlorobium limicola (strain DSM 245 / NBRC 103803 / 6330) TaxID=290315 RepID=B3EHP5_CHLL2|nr:protein TolQ [Chlorobium limicola]ACD89825.1 protein TolQ [Chlorobium limicola DSM 245]NTV08178.1 protein TolQ [Chlorobium limicola]NTV19774.1 protein TolQ [Chlorobium limicola]
MTDAQFGLFSLVSDAGPVVLLVLALLVGFSVISWTIIAYKFTSVRKSRHESSEFLDCFFEVSNLDRVFAESEKYRNGSLARVFRSGYLEYRAPGKPEENRNKEERIKRAIKREVNAETKRLSHLVPFLATVGNTAPFIGLFGTVWGIMNAFHNIGLTQSASLAAVAPGISEALVATAAGLAAAIPAVMGYNYLTQQIGGIERDLDDFSSDFAAACLEKTDKAGNV